MVVVVVVIVGICSSSSSRCRYRSCASRSGSRSGRRSKSSKISFSAVFWNYVLGAIPKLASDSRVSGVR